MKKKLLLLLFAFGTFFMFKTGVKADTVYEVSSVEDYFNKIEEIHNQSNEEFVIKLTDDITIDGETVIKNNNTIDNGNTVTIIGNGHTYSVTHAERGRFRVSNGTLNLGASDGSDTLTIQGAGDSIVAQYSLVSVTNSTLNMYDGVTLKDNKSTASVVGSAVRINSGGTFNMYGGLITNNSSEGTEAGGGAIILDQADSTFNMYDGEISNNVGRYYGGAIFVYGAGTLNIEGGTFKNNEGTYGGAIAVMNANATISNATFDGNTAYAGGALLSNGSGGFTITNCTFKNNTTDTYGGAIYSRGTLTISEESIYESNSANRGGAIIALAGTINSSSDIIRNNTATMGAGVYFNSNTAGDFSTTSVYNNKATTSGNDYVISASASTKIMDASEMTGYAEFDSKKVNLLNWYSDKSSERYSLNDPTTIVTTDDVEATGSFQLTASGNEAALVTFDTDGGDEVEEQVIELGNKATEPTDPTKYGYRFLGWYTSTAYDTEFDFDSAINEDVTVYAKWEEIIYEFTDESKDQEITQGSDATFTIDAPYSLFGKVYVDEELIDSSNYDSSEGSSVVTLKQSYIDTLSVGTHTLKVVFNDGGVATTTFTILGSEPTPPQPGPTPDPDNPINPNTGDDIMNHFMMLAIGFVGLFSSSMLLKISAKH